MVGTKEGPHSSGWEKSLPCIAPHPGAPQEKPAGDREVLRLRGGWGWSAKPTVWFLPLSRPACAEQSTNHNTHPPVPLLLPHPHPTTPLPSSGWVTREEMAYDPLTWGSLGLWCGPVGEHSSTVGGWPVAPAETRAPLLWARVGWRGRPLGTQGPRKARAQHP